MHQTVRQRRTELILLSILVVMLIAVAMFGNRASPEFWSSVRVLSVVLLTLGALVCLVKGVLVGFSKRGGWKAAASPLVWAVAGLILAVSQLWRDRYPMATGYLAVLGGVGALAAVVLYQRERERLED